MTVKPPVLDKPVPSVLLKPTNVQRLIDQGRLPKEAQDHINKVQAFLPKDKEPEPVQKMPIMKGIIPPAALLKGARMIPGTQHQARMLVQAMHSRIKIPDDKKPPCDTCKTSPCCTAFVVQLTKEEYESGYYGDYAIELTPEVKTYYNLDTNYLLEGNLGVDCPFLGEDKRCQIYEKRPVTCRGYTCVDDKRITQEIRDGKR